MVNTFLPNEKELLLQLSHDSKKAFDTIYFFYAPRLYGKILKLLKSEPDADEILQDVFMKIWEIRHSIDPEKSFRSFVFRITENKVYDFFRKIAGNKKLQQELLKTGSEEYMHVEETILSKENAVLLNSAVDSLPPQRREIFRLCKLEGKSYKAVSKKLGITTSTISDHMVKATHHIRKYFLRRA